MENKHKDKKGFYLTLYALATIFLLMAFGITILNNSSKDDSSQMQEPAAVVDKSNVKPITEITTANVSTNTESSIENNTATNTDKNQTQSRQDTANANEQPELELFNDNDEMSWPVDGQILMDYSTDATIYDKTLDQYRTNESICISAPLGSEVKSGADGTVASITKDDEKGVCVSIDHGNGWLSTYSQLQDNLAVSEGQTVYRGDKIGVIAQPTKYSVAIGPHLEFSVLKDEVSTDPKLVLASIE